MLNGRWLFPGSALALLLVVLCANGANAEGTYQHTEDGKTMIWNSDPRPGDTATWSGSRDDEGYAAGYGTLTWYTTKRSSLTESGTPSDKRSLFARYTGQMVRGKLNGPITAHRKGITSHATFVEGRKTSHWVSGPARAADLRATQAIASQTTIVEPKAPALGPAPSPAIEKPHEVRPIEKPREARVPVTVPKPPAKGPSPVPAQQAKQQVAGQAGKGVRVREMDDSLRALVGPPPLLRKNTNAEAAPAASASVAPTPEVSVPRTDSSSSSGPRLTPAEVIELANAEAHERGYDPAQYQPPQADYIATYQTWSILYNQTPGDDQSERGKHFIISVKDETKSAALVPGK